MNDKKQKAICPFKKVIEREYNGHKGMTTMRERFDVCAGERCMAYEKGRFDDTATCKRLEGGRS